MSNQRGRANRLVIVFILIGAVLCFNGCGTESTPNTQNANRTNTGEAAQAVPSTSPMTACQPKTNLAEFKKELQSKFGNQIDVGYQNNVLTYTGYIFGEKKLEELFSFSDQFRNDDCVKTIEFAANAAGDNFKWCKNEQCTVPPDVQEKCDLTGIQSVIDGTDFKNQLKLKKFSISLPKKGVLELTGRMHDQPTSNQLNQLFTKILEVDNGCISIISFGKKNSPADDLGDPFEIGNCTADKCECNGQCKTCTGTSGCGNGNDDDDNSNMNSNTNVNSSSNTNANRR